MIGNKLYADLDQVFLKQAGSASKLCYNSTSNPNESFNKMVASKAPKAHHYSKSENLTFRIVSAVSQKKHGEGYLRIVNKVAGVSTGKLLQIFQSHKMHNSTNEANRRRLHLKQSRFQKAFHLVK